MLTLGAVMERQKPKPFLWEDDGQYLSILWMNRGASMVYGLVKS